MKLESNILSQYDPDLGRLETAGRDSRTHRSVQIKPSKKGRGFKKSRVLVLDKDTAGNKSKVEVGLLKYCLNDFNCETEVEMTLQGFISKIGSSNYDYVVIDYEKYADAYGMDFDKMLIELLTEFHSKKSGRPKLINYTETIKNHNPKEFSAHIRKGGSLTNIYDKLYDLISVENDVHVHSRRLGRSRSNQGSTILQNTTMEVA